MFLHLKNTDQLFRSIRTATLIIVVLYMVFCCYLISSSYMTPPAPVKAGFSAFLAEDSKLPNKDAPLPQHP